MFKEKTNARNSELCRAFIAEARAILESCPELKHSWAIADDESRCTLDFPRQDENGFDIKVEAFSQEITVCAGDTHMHLDFYESIEENIRKSLGLVRDLLSPNMRLVEYLSSGRAYRWDVESLEDGKWKSQHVMGTFLYNFFGKRTKKIYQNKILPAR